MKDLIHKLSPHLFWDVNRDTIDPQAHRRYIISRILSRGTIIDFRALLAFYDVEVIKEEIKKTRSIDNKTANFAAIYFSIPKQEMRCYTWEQSRKRHWDY